MEASDGVRHEKFKAIIQDRELDNEVTRLDSKYGIQPPYEAIRLEICDLSQAILHFLTNQGSFHWLLALPDGNHPRKNDLCTGIFKAQFSQHRNVIPSCPEANICLR